MDLVRDAAQQVVGPVSGRASGLWGSVAGFVAAAAQGSYAVSPTGGEALLDVIANFKAGMTATEKDLEYVSQRPPLGQLEGGKVMAPIMENVATDPSGFATRHNELRDYLTKVEDAIKQAMANYQATELENEALLNQVQGRLG
jgi:hypothetical protein